MKTNNVLKSALTMLIIGLLMVTVTPVINHYFPMADFLKGFLNGLGLTFEVIAIIKMYRSKKKSTCTISNI